MNQFNKDIIAALSSDKDITLNEVLRRQIEVAANQFLQNELTAVLATNHILGSTDQKTT
uniref:hypothetical protein n=1 Tax=Phytohabitans flavus TaxID=1076124 RepID=UPI00366E88C6